MRPRRNLHIERSEVMLPIFTVQCSALHLIAVFSSMRPRQILFVITSAVHHSSQIATTRLHFMVSYDSAADCLESLVSSCCLRLSKFVAYPLLALLVLLLQTKPTRWSVIARFWRTLASRPSVFRPCFQTKRLNPKVMFLAQ